MARRIRGEKTIWWTGKLFVHLRMGGLGVLNLEKNEYWAVM
jgi:hypothetical protein